MHKSIFRILTVPVVSLLIFVMACQQSPQTVGEVMDRVVADLYESYEIDELNSLTDSTILAMLNEQEKKVLAEEYWKFRINVPAIVSVMRHKDQRTVPFWLEPKGFEKTDLTVSNDHYTYEVWQKRFEPGWVNLGINGFDKHRPVYFVSVKPVSANDDLALTDFYPDNQTVIEMETGAFTYHDWDELVLLDVPESLQGGKLLTTIRGRAREAHLIGAFRTTPFPSHAKPDQIMLTWSEEPQTTQTIQWRIASENDNGVVEVWPARDKADKRIINAESDLLKDRLLANDPVIHRYTAVIRDLQPGQQYGYRVGHPDSDNWSAEYTFQTAPEPGTPFSFIYFGDTHRSPAWGELVTRLPDRYSDIAFYTIAGDMVGTGLYRDDWDQLFAYSGEVFASDPLMPSLGNHDNQDGLGPGMFLELFDLPDNGPASMQPERVYAFEYSNALFLMLDATGPKQTQAVWLDSTLAASDATWKVAVFHFPPYAESMEYPDIQAQWGEMFDRYHVDLAMSGHVHYYMRTRPIADQRVVESPADGTIYLISIAIPDHNRSADRPDYAEVLFSGEQLYQKIDIQGNQLSYTAYNRDDQVRDEFVIVK
jgi:hypothetical protein